MNDTPKTDVMMKFCFGTDQEYIRLVDVIKLERELNAANERIDMLTACNAYVARIAKERDDALKRIKRLEEAGDHLESNLKEIWEETVSMQKWAKAKEAKP